MPKRVVIVGSGYVGLVAGAGFSEFGHDVTIIERDPTRVQMLQNGEIPIFEPELDRYVAAGVRAGRLRFAVSEGFSYAAVDVVLVAVGTPALEDRAPDFSQLDAALLALRRWEAPPDAIIVLKSTTPLGTHVRADQIVNSRRVEPLPIVVNPEFLREGTAVADFFSPHKVVVGTADETAGATAESLYERLRQERVPFVRCDPATAELMKYAHNAFLATKISFINEVAELAESFGADALQVANAMGLDDRISGRFLRPGPGFGGGCLPKDLSALLHSGTEESLTMHITRAVLAANEHHRTRAVGILERELDRLEQKHVALLGLTFKAGTDDTRESPALEIARSLTGKGATVTGYDPRASDEGVMESGVERAATPYDAAHMADAVLVLTEWPEFSELDMVALAAVMRGNVLVDMRSVVAVEAAGEAGLRCIVCGNRREHAPRRGGRLRLAESR